MTSEPQATPGLSQEQAQLGGEDRSGAALRFLVEAGQLLTASLDYTATIQHIASLTVPFLADWCTVDILEDGEPRCLAAAHVDPAKEVLLWELRRRYPLTPDGPSPGSRALRLGHSVLYQTFAEGQLASTTRDGEHFRLVTELTPYSAMAVPLILHGQTTGVMTLATSSPARSFEQTDLRLAEELASRAAVALDHARLYRELERALALRTQFLSIAAHELRTPLTTIKGYLTLARKTLRRSPPQIEHTDRLLTQLHGQLGRLEALVEDLLDVSRIQQGRVELRTEELDLVELAVEVVERYRASCEQLFELVAAGPIVGRWDPLRLDQILTNLLSNAVKFSPPESTVRLSVHDRDDEVVLTVADQGVGIAAEELPGIFEPFVRGQEAGRISGNGLGLFITRSLVEQHGGRITMHSVPGVGTTVTVHLPRQPATEASR